MTNTKENLPSASVKGRCSGRIAKHNSPQEKSNKNEKTAASTQEKSAQEDRLATQVRENLFVTKTTNDGYDGLVQMTSNLINLSLDRMDGKVRGMYERYQKMWADFCERNKFFPIV